MKINFKFFLLIVIFFITNLFAKDFSIENFNELKKLLENDKITIEKFNEKIDNIMISSEIYQISKDLYLKNNLEREVYLDVIEGLLISETLSVNSETDKPNINNEEIKINLKIVQVGQGVPATLKVRINNIEKLTLLMEGDTVKEIQIGDKSNNLFSNKLVHSFKDIKINLNKQKVLKGKNRLTIKPFAEANLIMRWNIDLSGENPTGEVKIELPGEGTQIKFIPLLKKVKVNKVKADNAIQLVSYTKVIAGLRNQIDNLKKRKEEENKKYDKLVKINENNNQEINTLENLTLFLKKEIELNEDKIASLNIKIEKTKNNTEFQNKYEEIKNQIKDVTNELQTTNNQNNNLESQLIAFKEIEEELITTITKKNEEVNNLQTTNLALKNEIENYKKKEEELKQLAEAAEEKRQEEERLAEEKRQEKERLAEEKRQEKEKQLREKEEAERLAREELNKKLSLLTQESDLEKAQNFLLNLERFIKEYPNEFDIIKISEYFIATRLILDGNLNFTNQTKLQELKDYVNETSELYSSYSKQILQSAKSEKLNKINEAISGLEKSIDELKKIMVTNQLSINLQQWTDTIKFAEISLEELNSYDELILVQENIDDLIKLKVEVDSVVLLANETTEELKSYLQENLTTELAPLILEQIKFIEDSIKKENIETINNINEKSKEFIFKKFIEPEEKRKAEEVETEKRKIIEKQNKKFEEIFVKFNAKNEYQKQIVKLLYFLDVPFDKIEFSNWDNDIKIYGIGDKYNPINLDKIEITTINKKYLDSWLKLNESYEFLSEVPNISEFPKLEYLGKIVDDIKLYGFNSNSIDLTVEEIGITNLDFENFDKIKELINSSFVSENDKDFLSLILSAKFDKVYFKNAKVSETEFASLKYFEISNWNEFSFDSIVAKDYTMQEEFNNFSLENFKISKFSLDKDYTYDLLNSDESQQLLLSGDYSEIFNSFVSLDNLELKNFKANINNSDVFFLDKAKISDLKFDYFGANNNIKVPTNLDIEINGADFNYVEARDINGGLAFLYGLVDEIGYEKIKFDFGTSWKWDTRANNISFNLDLGIADAASLAISTDLADLDTNILTIQWTPLLNYLMTTPKLKELSLSLEDNSLKNKLLNYVAKEQNMTTDQLKDLIIQTMDIYSNTLGINQTLVKEFLDATSNFINNSNKIVFSVDPPKPVSITDLTPHVMMQDYTVLTDKLNLSVRNY